MTADRGLLMPERENLAWKPHHIVMVSCVVLLFLIWNGIRITRWPEVWWDEAQDVEPAWHLAFGDGFFSRAHNYASYGRQFPGNPAFFLMLAGWMKLFGFGIVQVRWFSAVVSLVSALALVSTARRCRWLVHPVSNIVLLTTLVFSHGLLDLNARVRYDLSSVFLLASLFALAAHVSPRFHSAVIGVGALLLPTTNFLAPIALGLLFAGAVLLGYARWHHLVLFIVCVSIGTLALLFWFDVHGVMDGFIGSTRVMTVLKQQLRWRSVLASLQAVAEIHAVIWVALALPAWLVYKAFSESWDVKGRRMIVALIIWVYVVPVALYAGLHYAETYRWIVSIPTAIIFLALVERVSVSFPVLGRSALVLFCMLLLGGSMVRPAGRLIWEWNELRYTAVDDWVAGHLEGTVGPVIVAPEAYYPAKRVRPDSWVTSAELAVPPQVRERLSVAITDDRFTGTSSQYLEKMYGGRWVMTDSLVVPRSRGWIAVRGAPRQPFVYKLGMYRRVEAR